MNYFSPAPMTEGERVREFYGLGFSETNVQLLTKLIHLENRLKLTSRSRELAPTVRNAVLKLINSGAEWVGTGTSRIVFSYPGSNTVIKVPFSEEGQAASLNEAEALQNFQKFPHICTPIADCQIVDFTSSIGMKLLVMEQLHEFPVMRTGLPDWVASVDCGQVGYNSKKRLVAYDL
jgi:hypothetical protein